MIHTQAIAPQGSLLSEQEISATLHQGLDGRFTRQKVLVLIPDHTRTLPLPMLFRLLVEILHDARQVNFMVASGTHPAWSEAGLNQTLGITAEERSTTYRHIGLTNHNWDDPSTLATIGALEQDEIKAVAGEFWHPSLPERVEIRLNKAALECDQILVLGPTFPHEIVGISGGAKYFFPGISGPEMIHASHWLGALVTVVGTIGRKETPARAMIHAAAKRLHTPATLAALVVDDPGLAGVFVGDMYEAWGAAADLSIQRHIRWVDKPFQRVLSCAPAMYDELWTASKAMYKLEPAIAVGGELVLYAPHLNTVSQTHGKYIREIGYHILPYFLQNWERFKHVPLAVLAQSTHLRGSGVMENSVEKPNVRVTLASQIPAEECARLNLGYLDPASIHLPDWQDREEEGVLYVPKAGELLYRAK